MPSKHTRAAAVARSLTAGFATALLTVTVWAAVPAAPAAAASGPVTSTTTSNLAFSTSNQGMWGPGAPAALGSGNLNLFAPIVWNKSASAGNITTLSVDSNLDIDSTSGGDTDGDGSNDTDLSCTTWNNDWNGSIQEDGEISGSDNDGDLSSDGQTCVDSNADIDYINVDTDGDGGNQNDLASTSWGGSITGNTSGNIGLQMVLQNVSGGSVAVNYPVAVTQSVTAPGSFVKAGDQVTFASSWQAQPGASLATGAATGATGLAGTFDLSASASGQVCVSACAQTTVLGVSISKNATVFQPVSAATTVSAPGLTGSVSGASFGTTSSQLSGDTLTASGSQSFWGADLNLDSLIQGVTGIPLSASASVAGVNFGYTVISANANPAYSATQNLTFSPTLMETLTFNTPVAYTAYDAQGTVDGSGTASGVTFPAGGRAVITVPPMTGNTLTYSTSYTLSGTDFTNNSAVTGSVSSSFSALSLSANFAHAGNLSLGPVYSTSGSSNYNIPVLGQGTPFGRTSTSWNLGGFNSANGASGSLQVDTIPPTTTASVSGTLGNSGWYTGPATVTLSASDNPGGSGVAATYYSVDGGSAQTYSSPFTISTNGTHTVSFYSVDNAGNQEAPQSIPIKIDQAAPTTNAALAGPEQDGWYRSAQLTLSAQDNPGGSGVASTSYSVNGGATQTYAGTPVSFTQSGQYTVSYWSTDVAGNMEAQQSVSFQVDSTPPTTTASVSGKAGNSGWYTGPATVTLSASDNAGGSGVAATYYSIDGGATQTYGSAFTISVNGTHTVSFYSVDRAGNQETSHSLTVKVDQTPPTTTESLSGTMGTNGWYKRGSPVVLTLTATDNQDGSGVASTSYTVNGGAAKAYTAPVTFPDGVYTVSYGSTDVAGNVETPQTVSFKVDQTPPTVTYTGNAGTYTPDQTVAITCTAADNLSGVASTTCSNLDVPAYTLALGSHTLSATATDNAGNVGSGSTTFTVQVTYTSLCSLTEQFESKAGVASSLCSKLDAAASKAAAGDSKTAGNMLSAYENELSAQSGKSISAAHVTILDGYVTALESQNP